MPQVFQVLKCYKCMVFQVHQVKRSNKWQCKMCGEKQSIKCNYGIGTAKDCRGHVQKLNGIRGDIEENKLNNVDSEEEEEYVEPVKPIIRSLKSSRWSQYVEKPLVTDEIPEEPMLLNKTEVVLEIPKETRKKFNVPRKKPNVQGAAGSQEVETMYLDDISSFIEAATIFEIPDTPHVPREIHTPFAYNSRNPKMFNQVFNSSSSYNVTLSKEKQHFTQSKEKQIKPKIQHEVTKTSKNVFEPPPVNRNSKWANFVEEEENEKICPAIDISENSDIVVANEFNPPSPKEKNPPVCTKELFSLCEENEIDSLLDF